MNKALVALSNFKGTLTNEEATRIVASTLQDLSRTVIALPFGDGGAGTSLSVQRVLGGDFVSFSSLSPLGEKIDARVLCLPSALRPLKVFVESSQTCGYQQTPDATPSPMKANSRGLGRLLLAIRERWKGPLEIVIGLGDSAISDVGMGMMEELGFSFRDALGKSLIPGAESLEKISSIEVPKLFQWGNTCFRVLCDVENPLCGAKGSARTFAPQKGATPEQVLQIEKGMQNMATHLAKIFDRAVDSLPFTGSAGGLSAALHAVFGAELVPGARYLCDWLSFDELLAKCDCLVIGEGRTDYQTLSGKGPFELIRRAKALDKKVILLSGQFGEGIEKLLSAPPIVLARAVGREPSAAEALRREARAIFLTLT